MSRRGSLHSVRRRNGLPYLIFAIVFVVGLVAALPFIIPAMFPKDEPISDESVIFPEEEMTTTVAPTTTTVVTTVATEAQRPATTSAKGVAPTYPASLPDLDTSYFSDALFIGDSRGEGLRLYGKIDTMDFFVNVGMSVYKVEKETVNVRSVGNTKLIPLLQKKQYGKIYVCLGINEVGYNFNTTVNRYTAFIEKIRSLQPNAIIYVCANIHVSQKRSSTDKTVNNPNLNKLNTAYSKLANGVDIFYLDVNEIFDDANGNLRSDLTSDGTHIYAKCYVDWSKYLLSKAVHK